MWLFLISNQVLIILTPLYSFMCISPMMSHLILVIMFLHNFSCLLLFSCSIVSDSLWPRGLQHTRLSCPSPTPRACSNSSPLSQWYHSTISFSNALFSSCLQSFPASRSFLMSQLFSSEYWSFSFSISPSSEYSGLMSFRMDWLDLLAVQGTLKSLFQHHSSKHQFFHTHLPLWFNSHTHAWLLEKP